MYTIYYEKHVGSSGISQCSHGVATQGYTEGGRERERGRERGRERERYIYIYVISR